MLKCGYDDRDGIVLKLFDSPPQDKQIIVDGVIKYIDYAVDYQHILLYDFKPPNLCRSPFDNNEVVGLDYDPKYCKDVSQFADQPIASAVMKAYMFLMFACFQYDFGPKDPKIKFALHNGLERLNVASLLDKILRNPICVKMLKHYLYFDPSMQAIEVRDIIRDRYIGRIAADAGIFKLALAAANSSPFEQPQSMGGRKKKRKKSRRRM